MICSTTSTPSSDFKISSLDEVHPEKISHINGIFQRINKFYPHEYNIPGPANFFFIPYEFFQTCKALIYAQTIGNEEALQDSLLKIAGFSPFFLYSVLTISQLILQIGLLVGVFQASQSMYIIPKELLLTAATGIAFCTFEGGRNILNILKQQNFLSHISNKKTFSLDYWKDFSPGKRNLLQEETLESLEFFTPYIEKISQKTIDLAQKAFKDPDKCDQFLESFQEAKLAQLSKKVMPWFAEKIAKELPFILKKIQSDDINLQKEGILEARALLQDAKCQAQKQMLRQAIALIAIGLSLAGCIGLLFFSAPYLGWIPLVLFSISFLVYLINGVISSGILYHAGWTFNAIDCVPDWIRERVPSTGLKEEI